MPLLTAASGGQAQARAGILIANWTDAYLARSRVRRALSTRRGVYSLNEVSRLGTEIGNRSMDNTAKPTRYPKELRRGQDRKRSSEW